jgi:hypothetical protein
MFKKTLKSKKSSINRDTLLIIQVFILILIILLIIKQVETFNNKNNNEGFLNAEIDNTVILYIGSREVRLGDLSRVLSNNNNTYTANFNMKTLATLRIYDNGSVNKPSNDLFQTNTITHITLKNDYSAIIYDGNDFDNDKRSILVDAESKLALTDYTFSNKLSSIKIFKTTNKLYVLKREADYNNQILLFSKNDKKGEISRINLPSKKMINNLDINYFYNINDGIQNIYDIILPGTTDMSSADNKDGSYRNINLQLLDSKGTGKENIITDMHDISEQDALKNIKSYKITPRVPTLDTFTASKILEENMTELTDLEEKFKEIEKYEIDNNNKIQRDQKEVVEQLSNSLVKRLQEQNNMFNLQLFTHQ